MGPTDAELIAQGTRDPASFGALFDRHYTSIHRYAVARLGPDDGEDVAAQTFLIALEQRHRYDVTRPDARPWLFGIATNLIRRHQRSWTRARRALARVDAGRTSPSQRDAEDGIDLQQDARQVMDAVAALPSREREVLLLFAWADLSYEEIAQALHVPIGTVRSRLHRARHVLRSQLATGMGGAA